MNSDAFERFEKSPGGLLIPVAVFVFGAIATVAAMIAVQNVAIGEAAAREQLRPPEAEAQAAPDGPKNDAVRQPVNQDQGPKAP